MAPAAKAFPRSLRDRLRKRYGLEPGGLNNPWLGYSVKIDRDVMFDSDRRLLHWISFLETERSVREFELSPPREKTPGVSRGVAAIVETAAQQVEWHVLVDCADDGEPISTNPSCQNIRRISEEDLRRTARMAIRWMKPIAFASAIRGMELNACRQALVTYFAEKRSGEILQVLAEFDVFPAAMLLGMFARLSIEGVIDINLADRPFGNHTVWCSYERDQGASKT